MCVYVYVCEYVRACEYLRAYEWVYVNEHKCMVAKHVFAREVKEAYHAEIFHPLEVTFRFKNWVVEFANSRLQLPRIILKITILLEIAFKKIMIIIIYQKLLLKKYMYSLVNAYINTK